MESSQSAGNRTVQVRVMRQENPNSTPRWELFEVPYRPNMNVHMCLLEIQERPTTIEGSQTTPPCWEVNCLEEVCGSCTMVINGRVRQACSALVDTLSQPITIEPMSKFPVVRDLVVDRSRMFEELKKVKAWVPLDGTHALGNGPRYSQEEQSTAYVLSRCMTCGCCVEACPQYGPGSAFIGPAAINQVRRFNLHPTGALNKGERIETVMGPGGITDCGNAQVCASVCPKEIPLLESIAAVARDATVHSIRRWFGK
ncbi:MAG: succinate dehydrogenase iron-sulfur subunit [Planctomycetes bacterium]|nr:succinate dehydrogenase iron-sulfur subunit [Planctomycetota bacterium]